MFFQLVFKCRIRCWKQIKCFLDCCIFQTEYENQNSSRITFTFRYKENHVCSDRLNFNFSLTLMIFRLQKLLEGGGILTILRDWFLYVFSLYYIWFIIIICSLYVMGHFSYSYRNTYVIIEKHNGIIQQNRNFNGVVKKKNVQQVWVNILSDNNRNKPPV